MNDDERTLRSQLAHWRRYTKILGGALFPPALLTAVLEVLDSTWWLAAFIPFMILAIAFGISLSMMGKYKERLEEIEEEK